MKHNLKVNTHRSYINSIPLRHGEVTVVTSGNAVRTMQHCTRLASDAQKTGLPVLLVNCGMSDARFKEYYYEHYDPCVKKPELVLKSSVRGNLIGEREAIDQIVEEANIKVIVIAGWEWASSSWRRKQRLLFYLRELMEEKNIVVVIYSHVSNAPVAGEIDHGGLGKLSLLAMFIVEIEASEELEEVVPKPLPIVVQTVEELQAAERSAQLLARKINNLGEGKSEVRSPMSEVGE